MTYGLTSFVRYGSRDHSTPLTDDQIRRVAPSVFAEHPHESRSDKFAHIPTYEVVNGLRRDGFYPVTVVQGRSRIAGKSDFTKHLIRFRHESSQGGLRQVGDTMPEIVVRNAHDGTSAYHIMSGLFRLACLNGLIVADRQGEEVRVPHKGNVVDRVIEASYRVLSESTRALDSAAEWSGIMLSGSEREVFATAAHELRFARDENGTPTSGIRPLQLLAPRRNEDHGQDLWRTLNVVQEHVMRGGDHGVTLDANGRRRNTTSRAINGVSDNVRLNQALWTLTQRMAELKAAA